MKRLLTLLALAGGIPAAQADSALLQRPEVQAFITERVQQDGFTREALEKLFADVTPRANIVAVMDKPSTSRPFYQFRPNFINERLIAGGVRFWAEHAGTLARAEREYGVPPEVVVAILGIESGFGRNIGSFRVADALTTLAFDYPRRADYFRGELVEFLRLAREEGWDALSFKSSYAGAMGWPQFMPSSFRKWAVDFDGDGHRDIWNNPVDVIGSVAHYFQEHGWRRGDDVLVPADVAQGPQVDALVADKFKLHYTVAELRAMGVTPRGDVADGVEAVLFPLEVAAGDTRYWLGLNNFYVITRYNRSTLYAMVVHELSVAVRERYYAEQAARMAQAPA